MPKIITTAEFIERAKTVHSVQYDYSQVVYTKIHDKVKIIDPVHGEFWQSPCGHLQGQDHPARASEKVGSKRRMPLCEFIRRANKIHNNLYDYSKVTYKDCDTPVLIVDPEYGEFWQSPYQHLRSHGCPERTKNKKWEIHVDHIIPLSIIRRGNVADKWFKDRPLFKFLNSEVNLISVTAKFNRDKSDSVTVNGKTVPASTVRNNYEIISYLIKSLLKIDPTDIINADKEFINDYFGISKSL